MNVKHHGEWEMYNPASPHPDAPSNAVYSRRKEDGIDWYTYVSDESNFSKDTIKVTCAFQQINIEGDERWVVMVANHDATVLFPQGILLELTGVEEINPQKFFERKGYDPETEKFSEEKMYG